LLNSHSENAASLSYRAFASRSARVVFLTDIPTPYIIEIMRELSSRVDLLCLFCAQKASRGMDWNFESKLGFRHLVIGGMRIKRHADTTDYYISPRIFWRLLRARPDAIISGGFSIPSFYAHLYCKLTGAKLIIYSDGTPAYEKGLVWPQRVARKVLVPRVSAFIAKSKPAADRFEELGAKGRIFLAPHTTNLAPLLEIGASRDWSDNTELRLLSVGRLIPRKGIRHLIRALAAVRPVRRPVSLTIVGSGPQEAELRALVQSLGLRGIRFVGFVDQRELPAYYAAADAFVFPTLEDPYGIVLLEAAASGLALIASEHAGATQDFVKYGESGLVFDPHDEPALAELIAKLADCPKLVRDLGLAAHNVARLRTPDRTAEKYVSAIMAVVSGKANPPGLWARPKREHREELEEARE
jgi:glycosyltransferase involved in cell wall biosynthesis